MPEAVTITFPAAVAGLRIGLVGVGRMGAGIGANLLRHGASLGVKGRRGRAGIERVVSLGAREHSSLGELASQSDVVILSLPSSRETEGVCLGPDGLLTTLAPGSLLIDCTTSQPASSIALGARAAGRGISFADAPVTRSPKEAEQGRLIALIGAEADVLPRVTGIVAAFCEAYLHAGAVGDGHRLKLLNNAISLGTAALAAETGRLAHSLGVDIATFQAVVRLGASNSTTFQSLCAFLRGEDPDALAFSIANGAKDLRYLLEEGARVSSSVPVLASISRQFEAATAAGLGDATLPNLASFTSGEARPR